MHKFPPGDYLENERHSVLFCRWRLAQNMPLRMQKKTTQKPHSKPLGIPLLKQEFSCKEEKPNSLRGASLTKYTLLHNRLFKDRKISHGMNENAGKANSDFFANL
jgi:hypothetical protein